MHNKYLRDRAMRRGRDYRNPYGSRGGYVRDSRRGRGYDRAMDERYDYAESGHGDYRGYDRYDRYDERDYRDYERYGKYDRHYENDMSEDDEMDKEYKKDLEEWIMQLKKKDVFKLSKEDVIQKAKAMNVTFDEYDELEFYAAYLMLVGELKQVANDPHFYLAKAKQWLESDGTARKNSDKICAYLYSVVLGE